MRQNKLNNNPDTIYLTNRSGKRQVKKVYMELLEWVREVIKKK